MAVAFVRRVPCRPVGERAAVECIAGPVSTAVPLEVEYLPDVPGAEGAAADLREDLQAWGYSDVTIRPVKKLTA